jgi:autotransporter translocation and assembly factor TamB
VTNLNGEEITLTVTGRVDNLQTDLSANPPLSRDEIVATLLHAPQVASVLSATPGQAQTQLYAEAQNYFNAELARNLLFPVESLLAQTINVEQIALIYDAQGNVNVEVRKLITPTVYAIYRSSLNVPVTQTAGVAYTLRDYADLEILQTQSPTGLQQSVLNLRLTFH